MKSTAIHTWPAAAPALALAAALSVSSPGTSSAQVGDGIETDRDLPGDLNKYYGQRRNQYRDIGRRLAKVDLDGDFNYDGVIDNDDPADNGAFQQTPPGLVLGVGEISQLIIRIRPYHLDFDGRAVVSLQFDGINRAHKSGEFASPEEERQSVGHIRVWRDPARTQLILDSRDPSRQLFEWSIDDSKYPANVPGIVPRTVYVEGVSPSGQYSGDVRLLLKVQHRKHGATSQYGGGAKSGKGIIFDDGGVVHEGHESEKVVFKRFSTSYDHILLTIQNTPHRKEFINGNAYGVWSSR